MAQKSLLSFFKPKINSNLTNGNTGEDSSKFSKEAQSADKLSVQISNEAISKFKKVNLVSSKKGSSEEEDNGSSPAEKRRREKDYEIDDGFTAKHKQEGSSISLLPATKKKRRRIIALASDSEEETRDSEKDIKSLDSSQEDSTVQKVNKTEEEFASPVNKGKLSDILKKKTNSKKKILKETISNMKSPNGDDKVSNSPAKCAKRLREVVMASDSDESIRESEKIDSSQDDVISKSNSTSPEHISTKMKTDETKGEQLNTSVSRGKLSDVLKNNNSSRRKTPKKTTSIQIKEQSKDNSDKLNSKMEKIVADSSTEKFEDRNNGSNGILLNATDDTNNVWKTGVKTPYLNLTKTLQIIEDTSARLKIINILSSYFRKVIMHNKDDLLPSIYLCLNTLGPSYEGRELGIAETYLMKAIAQCTGRTLAQIKSDSVKTGDLGIVAEQSRSNQKIMFQPALLTIQGVFIQLNEIAGISGKDSMQKKIDKIQSLFVACRECEARFLIRSLLGKLRIGLAEQSIIQALALACTTTPPNQVYPCAIEDVSKTMSAEAFKKLVEEELLILKTTYCECPNFNLIVPVLLEHGIKDLSNYCKITPGIPVKPMLAQPTKGIQEVLNRFGNIRFTCEWKYDGERAQVHILENGSIKIYSRNQEDITSKYPDIIEHIRESIRKDVSSCIIDAEAVAWDTELMKIMPFQVLSTRKRKDADVSKIKVQVCVFFFDVLYINGESLTQHTLEERRSFLKDHFQEVKNKFSFVRSIDTNTMEEVQECLEESVKGNCEGLMVKTLDTDATYEIAKRSRNWLKLKKDYLDGCGDTLDLVVVGGYIGKGKRTGQYGGFLLASYDTETEEYQTICKIGTGFTEETLAAHSEFLRKHIIPEAKRYYRYDSAHPPDHWFEAVQVWEVKCADLSLSPVYHSAIGLVDPDKGISLRFPRFLRIRDDKNVEQATSSKQVAELYQNQDQVKNNAQDSKFNEEDF